MKGSARALIRFSTFLENALVGRVTSAAAGTDSPRVLAGTPRPAGSRYLPRRFGPLLGRYPRGPSPPALEPAAPAKLDRSRVLARLRIRARSLGDRFLGRWP